ncbi:hypothetical protein HDV00_007505 [Rhizophlyctis rosea]|nr:hypothetical protein HDV00_007505 [Rhizophlyctis rosea]
MTPPTRFYETDKTDETWTASELHFFQCFDGLFADRFVELRRDTSTKTENGEIELSSLLDAVATLIAGDDLVAVYLHPADAADEDGRPTFYVAVMFESEAASIRARRLLDGVVEYRELSIHEARLTRESELLEMVNTSNQTSMASKLHCDDEAVIRYRDCEDASSFRRQWGGGDDLEDEEVETLRLSIASFRRLIRDKLTPTRDPDTTLLREVGRAACDVVRCALFADFRSVVPGGLHRYILKAARVERSLATLLKWASNSENHQILKSVACIAVKSDHITMCLRSWEDVVMLKSGEPIDSSAMEGLKTHMANRKWISGVLVPMHAELNLLRFLIREGIVVEGSVVLGCTELCCLACWIAIEVLAPRIRVEVRGCNGKVEGLWRDPKWAGCIEALRTCLNEGWERVKGMYREGGMSKGSETTLDSLISHVAIQAAGRKRNLRLLERAALNTVAKRAQVTYKPKITPSPNASTEREPTTSTTVNSTSGTIRPPPIASITPAPATQPELTVNQVSAPSPSPAKLSWAQVGAQSRPETRSRASLTQTHSGDEDEIQSDDADNGTNQGGKW